MFISSCGNDELLVGKTQTKDESESIGKLIESASVDVIISTENDWSQLFSSNGEFQSYEEPQIPLGARAYIDSRTVKGNTSCNPRPNMGDLKIAFNKKEECDRIGITMGVYITDYCEAKMILYTGEGERVIPVGVSPNCGIRPDGDGVVRGYSCVIDGNKAFLTTYLTHIKYDMLGKPVDIWYPVHPSNLIWNYDIYLPHWN